MSFNTGICPYKTTVLTSTFTLLKTPSIAQNASEPISVLQNQTQWVYVSTIEGTNPNYTYQYKSEAERIQAKMGRCSLR
jgi:hypothetical protein